MSAGCDYVLSHKKVWNGKTKQYDDVPIRCGKLVGESGLYCPKHELFVIDEALEPKRKEGARILRRNLKTMELESLRDSPLAAINPKFNEQNKRTGYER